MSKTENNKPKKNIKKILIFIIVLIVLIYFIYAIIELVKQPTDIFVIENGGLSEEESAVGYIIRKETVVQGNNYKNGIMQIKKEGEKVAKGESIFRYYSNNEESLVKKIEELDVKIQEAMEQDNSLPLSDMKILDNQIQQKLLEASNLNDIQKIEEYRKDISNLVTKKAKIAGDLSPAGSYIRKLIEERSSYETTLNSGSEYIQAPESGIVSYRVDGLESTLTPDSFSTLNKKFLDGLNLKTGEIIATSDENGKIIDNFEGYIATNLQSEKANQANVGDNVTLRLSNSAEIPATIEYIIQDEDSKLIIFKITNDLEQLANYRKITFDVIWWSYNGLKVPNSSLIKETSKNGKEIYSIIRNRMGYTDKIIVKVLKQNNSYSIITNYTKQEFEELGYNEDDIKAMKEIVLYDEIVLKPKV